MCKSSVIGRMLYKWRVPEMAVVVPEMVVVMTVPEMAKVVMVAIVPEHIVLGWNFSKHKNVWHWKDKTQHILDWQYSKPEKYMIKHKPIN